MLFIWYLWAVKYYWVPISLIVVMVWAILCPPVFILLCETLPRLVTFSPPPGVGGWMWLLLVAHPGLFCLSFCRFTLFLCCHVHAFFLFFFLRHASTSWHWPVSMSHLPSSSLSWSFFKSLFSLWLLLAGLSFSSGLVLSQKDPGVTQGFHFQRCLPRRSTAVSVTAVLKWVTMESSSAFSTTSVARGAHLPPTVAWEALITFGSFKR